ncbi:MAG: hypothetical protein JNK63_08120 [Chthonomonas sp.]|nr:hypothetical protein [Chthonomonas sp.]
MFAIRAIAVATLGLIFTGANAEIAKCHVVFLQATGKEAEGDATARMKAHLEYLQGLWDGGKALAIGPLEDGGPIRGLQILKTDNPILANAWASGDPMVKDGYLRPVALPWWTDLVVFTHTGAFMDLQPFTFSLLYAPADRPNNPEGREQRQTEHMANINKMYNDGHLVAAGPFDAAHRYRGLFVFRGTDRAAIDRMTKPDPLLGGGYLKMIHYTWYTSKGNFPAPK